MDCTRLYLRSIYGQGYLGWGSAIIGGVFCGFVAWFLAFVLTGAAISGISKATNSVKYIPDPIESHDIVALQDNIYATCFRNADGYLKITYLCSRRHYKDGL